MLIFKYLTQETLNVTIRLMLKDMFYGLCDLVYPPNCLICKKFLPRHESDTFRNFTIVKPTEVLCLSCLNKIDYNRPPFCPKCSRHLGKNFEHPRCQDCSTSNPHFDFAWAACLYHDPLRHLIHKFKYHQKTLLSPLFSKLIISFIREYNLDIEQFDIITPIPLFPSRLRERGYNQSQLLAQTIAQTFNINLSLNNLIRVQNTKNQTLLSKKERWTNIHKAFRIKNLKQFSEKSILLIDDLLTTGATASEAARTIKSAGVKTVGVLTLAIA